MEKRFRKVTGCSCGWRHDRTEAGICCPECGATFMPKGLMSAKIDHDYTIREAWIQPKKVWFKPSTWYGRWERITENDLNEPRGE